VHVPERQQKSGRANRRAPRGGALSTSSLTPLRTRRRALSFSYLSGFFTTTSTVLAAALPRVFEDVNGRAVPAALPAGSGGPAAAATIGGDFSPDGLDAVAQDATKKLEAEVLAPMQRWLTAFATVAARMKRLEGVRLEVDSRRRTVVGLGAAVDAQRLRLPHTRSKGEWQMEQTIKKMQHKENKLAGKLEEGRGERERVGKRRGERDRNPAPRTPTHPLHFPSSLSLPTAARQAFKEQEALVFQQLAQLIRDAVWVKSYLAAVMRLQQEAFGCAAAALGPAKAALASAGSAEATPAVTAAASAAGVAASEYGTAAVGVTPSEHGHGIGAVHDTASPQVRETRERGGGTKNEGVGVGGERERGAVPGSPPLTQPLFPIFSPFLSRPPAPPPPRWAATRRPPSARRTAAAAAAWPPSSGRGSGRPVLPRPVRARAPRARATTPTPAGTRGARTTGTQPNRGRCGE